MKFDLTKLPVWEGIAGFLVLSLAVTFYFAFQATDNDEAGGEPAASETPAGTPIPDGATIAMSMRDNFFEPKQLLVAAGAGVSFDITNEGAVTHNMRIAGADGEYNSDDDGVSDPARLNRGEEATLTWTAPDAPGEIDFQCDFHPGQMSGTITVQ